jgi:hypothetical protein
MWRELYRSVKWRDCITRLSERKYCQYTLHLEHSTEFTKKNERFLHRRVLAQCNSEYNSSSFKINFQFKRNILRLPIRVTRYPSGMAPSPCFILSRRRKFKWKVMEEVADGERNFMKSKRLWQVTSCNFGTYFHFHEIE